MSVSRTSALAIGVPLLTGCVGGGDVGDPDLGPVTLKSGDSTATVEPLCVGDLPDDLADCQGAEPDDVGQVALDQTRKATLQVPADVAENGFRIRLNDTSSPPAMDGVLEDQSVAFRIPEDVVEEPGPTTVTVVSLFGKEEPRAAWRFALDDSAA